MYLISNSRVKPTFLVAQNNIGGIPEWAKNRLFTSDSVFFFNFSSNFCKSQRYPTHGQPVSNLLEVFQIQLSIRHHCPPVDNDVRYRWRDRRNLCLLLWLALHKKPTPPKPAWQKATKQNQRSIKKSEFNKLLIELTMDFILLVVKRFFFQKVIEKVKFGENTQVCSMSFGGNWFSQVTDMFIKKSW